MRDLLRRRGRVRISSVLIKNHAEQIAKEVFAGALVTRCEHLFDMDGFEYSLCHPEFDLIEDGEISPQYEIFFTLMPDGSVTHKCERVAPGGFW